MITGSIKNQVDAVWDQFRSNGVSNPLTVIEQMSYLIFMRALDDVHTARERKARRLGREIENPVFGDDQQDLRWSDFKNEGDPKKVFKIVGTKLFEFIKELGSEALEGTPTSFARHMEDAVFLVPERILVPVIEKIDEFPLTGRDTKGDLYEYMLSKLAQAGQNGQFRTPRHIIKMMVDLVQPSPKDTICDPACGTAGFLVGAAEYLREHHPEIQSDPKLWDHFQNEAFAGFDFDATMLRIASMNLYLHGIEDPDVDARDSLSQDFAYVENEYSLILANPPFKGSIDYDNAADNLLKLAKTKKTELLFVAQILRALKAGGRAAVIVPDGVLFGSSKAHKAVRKALVEKHKLDAVVSMPSGVFKPYAGVSTAVLIFTKTGVGGTENVWFYDMTADGFSLDDKRDPVEENDIPVLLEAYREREASAENDRTAKAFWVPKAEIVEHDFDLSINRYKEIVYEEVEYDPPKVIIERLRGLEDDIRQGLNELEGMIG